MCSSVSPFTPKFSASVQFWQDVSTFTSKCRESCQTHFSDLLNLHLKTMHGLAPNWPIVPWLIDIFRRVAVPPHKCCHEDLHQHAITSVPEFFATLYDRLYSAALPRHRMHAPEALTHICHSCRIF